MNVLRKLWPAYLTAFVIALAIAVGIIIGVIAASGMALESIDRLEKSIRAAILAERGA